MGIRIEAIPPTPVRCRFCGSTDLTEVTPYWSRCKSCSEMNYMPPSRMRIATAAEAAPPTARRLYGTETVPLPVLTDPRTRLVEGLFGLTAAGLFAVSLPLAIVLLAGERGDTIDDLLRAPGVSLIVTLWIFTEIALASTAAYTAVLVLRKRSEAGSAWVTFGVIAASFCGMFVVVGHLTGAWVGLAAGALILVAGLFDTILAVLKKAASESVRT